MISLLPTLTFSSLIVLFLQIQYIALIMKTWRDKFPAGTSHLIDIYCGRNATNWLIAELPTYISCILCICKIAINPKFEISHTTLVETLPRSMQEFLEQICCALSDKMSFELFSPIWSHVNEKKKKWQKSKIWIFANLYTTVVETLPRSMHECSGVDLEDVVWSFFSSALCYCTAELLSSRGRPSSLSVVVRRP